MTERRRNIQFTKNTKTRQSGEDDIIASILQRLIGEWGLLADLSFADLVLWVRTPDGGWIAVAHCRPSTGPTVYYHDVVGSRMPAERADLVGGTLEVSKDAAGFVLRATIPWPEQA